MSLPQLGLDSGCTQSPTGRNQLILVSPETAISASKEAYISTMMPLAAEGRIDNNPAVTERIQELTGRLVHEAIERYPYTGTWEWSIKTIDDPEVVNVWCMAGGKMAPYSGLLTKTNPTDDELAQLLAHETGNAVSHHTAEIMGATNGARVASFSEHTSFACQSTRDIESFGA